jgi:predicted DNA-binding transcriptional regulator AlpA
MDGIQPNVTARRNQKKTPAPLADRKALSVNEFCDVHGISRAFFYKLRKLGRGPVEMKIAARTLISIEAAAAWRRQMETEAAA